MTQLENDINSLTAEGTARIIQFLKDRKAVDLSSEGEMELELSSMDPKIQRELQIEVKRELKNTSAPAREQSFQTQNSCELE